MKKQPTYQDGRRNNGGAGRGQGRKPSPPRIIRGVLTVNVSHLNTAQQIKLLETIAAFLANPPTL